MKDLSRNSQVLKLTYLWIIRTLRPIPTRAISEILEPTFDYFKKISETFGEKSRKVAKAITNLGTTAKNSSDIV